MVESRRGRSVDMQDQENSPVRERWSGERNDTEERGSDDARESGKHRSKEKSKSSSRRDEKEYRTRDQERLKDENKDSAKDRSSGRDRKKEERDEREKDRVRDTVRDKDPARDKYKENDRDKERKDRTKGSDRVSERERDLEKEGERARDKDRGDKGRDKDRDREKEKDRSKDKEREKHRDRERERDNGRSRGKDTLEREKGKERNREKEKHTDQEKGGARDRDRTSRKQKDESNDEIKDMGKDDNSRSQRDSDREYQSGKEVKDNPESENASKLLKNQGNAQNVDAGSQQSASELEERITRMREERLKKSAAATEVSSWVVKSRKLEEKRNSAKEKALQRSRIFEEQDNMNDGDSDDDAAVKHTTEDLGGVKILHGLDKVLEGGAVVLTLKDQSILADGDINEEVDMLENVEIGEQKRRNEAYKAAKKKNVYDDIDEFNDGFEKKMLPQYDDPVADEGVTLDSSGRFTGEAERKLEELRKRIQGISSTSMTEDLNSNVKISTDYLTQEEMVKFKKPKKKKSLRKKEKLDLDALEAEAVTAGLGSGDLGSRNNGGRKNLREEQDRIDAEMRKNAYQSAYAKADEASKALRVESTRPTWVEDDDATVFGDDDDELRKSLERARKIALKKQDEEKPSLPALALPSSITNDSTAENSNNNGSGEQHENKVVFTEMEEFVWGLQHDEETQKPDGEDVFMEEDEAPITADHVMPDADSGWTEVKETVMYEASDKEDEKEEVVPDETIHESAVGKGLAATLRLLKDRGALKETIEWGGRNMDKKKSKLVGINDEDDGKKEKKDKWEKEIRIERTDEYGRILTPKEAFRLLSHKFHGKEPGKMKKEKRMRQYQEEMKVKQMNNADTPSHSVTRMREAQAQLQTPYLVLSGNVKPGQTSDPRSGFATVEKNLVGSLTPMLGDAKVEHFLNIKRRPDSEASASQKKPKT